MAGALGSLNIQLSLDAASFSQGLGKAQQSAAKFATSTNANLNSIEKNVQRLTKNIKSAERFFKVNLFAAMPAQELSKLTDAYTELDNRLKLVTANSTEQAAAMQTVFDIAARTSQSLSATGQVYQNFAKNAEQLGLSQERVGKLTETVSKAVALSGASAAQAEAGLTQFGQALAAGVFKGQDLKSVMQQIPGLTDTIAKGLGITTDQLREMGDELDTGKVIAALEKMKAAVDIDYSNTATTISGAFETLHTQTVKFVGELDKSLGVSQGVAKSILAIANNLDKVAIGGVALLAGIFGAYQASRGVHHLAVYIENRKKATAQEKLLAQAHRERAVALQATTAETLRATTVEYQAMKARVDHLRTAQQQTLAERELLAVQLQSMSGSARIAGMAQYNALKQQETVITHQLTLAERELTIAKTALKTAYVENAVTQSAANAGLVRSSALMTGYRAIVRGATAELQLMKAAFLSNPLMLGITAITTLAAFAGYWFATADATEEATQKAKEYSQSIDTSKEALQQMSAVALKKQIQDLEKNQAVFKRSVEEKKRLIADLEKQIVELGQSLGNYGSDGFYSFSSQAQQMQKLTEKLVNEQYALENAEKDLEHVTKQLTDSQGGLNEKLGIGSTKTPDVTNKVLVFSGSLEELKLSADDAKKSLNELFSTLYGKGTVAIEQADGTVKAYAGSKLSADYLKDMANLQSDQKRAGLKGKALFLHDAKKNAADKGYVGKMADDYVDQYVNTKLAEEHHRSSQKKLGKSSKTDYAKQYTDQLSGMQQRLAELKANTQDIVLFGQPSQYQEVNKLTQDIAFNAEKYAHFGIDGLKKLQEMATLIDAEQQKAAVLQFGYDNSQKLQAMEFELTLLGRTRQEQELLRYNHQLDLEATKLKIGMSAENIALLDQEIAKLKERYAIIQAETEKNKGSAIEGFKQGMANIEDDVSNVASNVANITENAFNGMSNALTDFVLTGKADFRSLAQSIIKDITSMIVKMMLFNAIKTGMQAIGIPGFADGGAVGFAAGGYTGDGGKYTPASIVHRGEYVITKEATSRLGRGFLDSLNYGIPRRGFANGGGVGVPMLNYHPQTAAPNVKVTVINNGQPAGADVRQTQRGNELEITVELLAQMDRIADQRYRKNQQNDLRSGGVFAR